MSDVRANPGRPAADPPVEFSGVTRIGLVVDRSGSMGDIAVEANNSLASWLAEAKLQESASRTVLRTVLFDDRFDWSGPTPLLEAQAPVIKPRNMTALYDAAGMMIQKISAEASSGDRVLLIVMTDGHENASREFAWAKLKALIEGKKASGLWTFVFLASEMTGSNIAFAGSAGVGNRSQYEATPAGVTTSGALLRTATARYMAGGQSMSADFFRPEGEVQLEVTHVAKPTEDEDGDAKDGE